METEVMEDRMSNVNSGDSYTMGSHLIALLGA